MTPQDQLLWLDSIVPHRTWVLIAVAGTLLLLALAFSKLRSRRALYGTYKLRPAPPGASRGGSPITNDQEARGLSDRFKDLEQSKVLTCQAELVERRPLSEAQWDSPVPAAWTIFTLKWGSDGDSRFQLGLLLPVQHKEAYSSGFIERVEGSGAEDILRGFANALAGPVPGNAISGSPTGFLEFKTYVENDKPEVIPGNLDLAQADYWILVKMFVQDSLELYLRLNPNKGQAEIVGGKPAQGEELMRILAATLRPES